MRRNNIHTPPAMLVRQAAHTIPGQHKFKSFAKKAGLPGNIHFHSLRHTGISLLISKGVPAPFVQKIAGHSSLAVTGIYMHYEGRNLSEAMRAFDSFSRN
jgi:integrase